MIKLIDDLKDKLTSKVLNFIVEREYAEEVIDMLSESTNSQSIISKGIKPLFKEITLRVSDDGEKVNYNISIEMTDKEWTELLRKCNDKNYQLVIKKDHDQMVFTKVESK